MMFTLAKRLQREVVAKIDGHLTATNETAHVMLFRNLFNKFTAVFYASVLLLMINCVIKL